MTMIDIPRYRDAGQGQWELLETFTYYSRRYNQEVTCEAGTYRDGATGAMDIRSQAWWVHDELCARGTWDDGTPVTNWQASMVLSDILHAEGRWVRSKTWFWATYFFGCDKARKNGMFRRKE